MIDFIIGMIMGGVMGVIFALFIAGESTLKREKEAYREGYLDGKNGVQK